MTSKRLLTVIRNVFLAFVLLISILGVLFAIFLYANSIPPVSIDLINIAKDTTFYVGANQSQSGEGSNVSIRAEGQVDDSTACVLVTYPNDTLTPIKGILKKGRIDQLWISDFYNRRAKITFLHKTVKRGHLRLQVNFSYPPTDWGYKETNRGWVKAK